MINSKTNCHQQFQNQKHSSSSNSSTKSSKSITPITNSSSSWNIWIQIAYHYIPLNISTSNHSSMSSLTRRNIYNSVDKIPPPCSKPPFEIHVSTQSSIFNITSGSNIEEKRIRLISPCRNVIINRVS